MNPYFSRSEFLRRYENARSLMRNENLGALLITSEPNLYYLSGHEPFQPWYTATRPTVIVAPLDHGPVLVVSNGYLGAAQRDAWIEDIRAYPEISGSPVDTVIDVMRELKLADTQVGAEIGIEQRLGVTYSEFVKMKSALPNVQWMDAAPLLWKLRIAKSQPEIECIRKACQALMQAFQQVLPNLTAGTTHEEVTYRMQGAICDAGAEPGFVVVTFDQETRGHLACLPTSKQIEPGQLVWVDAGAKYHGYWCDFCRATSIGKPSKEVLQTWEAVHHLTSKGLEVVKPGVSINEIAMTCMSEAKKMGLPLDLAGGRMGHGLGLMLTEQPSITAKEEMTLKPGMVLAIEPGFSTSDGMFVIEQNFAVTEGGYDLLSEGAWKLWTA